jgi:hypothetical protein
MMPGDPLQVPEPEPFLRRPTAAELMAMPQPEWEAKWREAIRLMDKNPRLLSRPEVRRPVMGYIVWALSLLAAGVAGWLVRGMG